MRPVVQTLSAVGVSPPVVLDYLLTPMTAGIACVVSNPGVLTYKVQYSYDDPFTSTYDPATATWFDHATLNAQTTTQSGVMDKPVRCIRLDITARTSGSVTMTVVQSGD